MIRQSRIKKDIDSTQSPSSPDEIDYEPCSSPYTHLLSSKMERHASEPSPRDRLSSQSPPLSSAAMHLLTVPHTPVLTKQHSAPSQSICDTQFSYHRQECHPHFSLHRQLSLPSGHSPPSERMDSFTGGEEKEPLAASNTSHTVRTMTSTAPISDPKLVRNQSPAFVVVSEPSDHVHTMRVRSEELQRSVSSPQVGDSPFHSHLQSSYCFFTLFSAFITRNFIGKSFTALPGDSTGAGFRL